MSRNETQSNQPPPGPLDPAVPRLFAEANGHHHAGRHAEAAALYRQVIALLPGFPGTHNNLGNALRDLGLTDEAIASYRRAIALDPGLMEAHFNLGGALRNIGRLDEAAAAYRQAIALKPDFWAIHNNLGLVLQDAGRPEDALTLFERAVALAPDQSGPFFNLCHARKLVCVWADFDAGNERYRASVRAGGQDAPPFEFLAVPSSPAEQLHCARTWSAARTKGIAPLAPPRPAAKDRLRIAYLSANYRHHPMALLLGELIERHDRGAFEVIGYSFGVDDGSVYRRRMEQAFDRFVDIRALSHTDSARRIRADGIDILVDLMGHTREARLPILAQRPAPIQVNFLGYPASMGAPFIDYVIADPITVPMSEQPFFDEKIVHLSDCYKPRDTFWEAAPRTPSRAESGLPESGFVFCCFNNPYKITPAVFDIWMRLLRTVPESVLWLLAPHPLIGANLAREAAARGVRAQRLILAPRLPLPEHLARHRLADLFLDTLPVNAHTTASDSLWAGVPVLTCRGDCFAGRVAASLLHAIGLPELVTSDAGQYESMAGRLACDPALLGALRGRLRANRLGAPLFDATRFVRRLETAYRRMWDLWAAGRPPEPLAAQPDVLIPY